MKEGFMKKYNDNTVYFISYARLPNNMPAAKAYAYVGVGLVINLDTGIIEDNSCTLMTDEAREFLKDIVTGHNLYEEGIDNLIDKIKLRYHGYAQKSICVALKDTYKRFIIWKESIEE